MTAFLILVVTGTVGAIAYYKVPAFRDKVNFLFSKLKRD
jgi:hypothetical protein